MQAGIHPEYVPLKATCSCGNVIETFSTIMKGTLSLDVCLKCHPFYTGKQRVVDTAGRVINSNVVMVVLQSLLVKRRALENSSIR